jgi:hypothetical protein
MKLLQIILALHVLVLSALPCGAVCLDESASVTTQTSTPTSQSEDDGWCSPFTICTTCLGFSAPQPPVFVWALPATALYLATAVPLYKSYHELDVLARIWTPPQLI